MIITMRQHQPPATRAIINSIGAYLVKFKRVWLSRVLSAPVALALLVFAVPSMAGPPPGYNLEWSDEFSLGAGQPPNPSVWNHETGKGKWGTGELEDMVADVEHSHIVADPNASDGLSLQLEATDDNGGTGPGGSYSSARLDTSGNVMPKYGYLEARIQSPFTCGSWPAWWMLGSDYTTIGWPFCGEIDIMENPGLSTLSDPNDLLGNINWATLHFGYTGDSYDVSTQWQLPNGNYFEGYHTYAMQWSPDLINFFIDGNFYGSHTAMESSDVNWPYNAPQYFLLDLAVGGNVFSEYPDSIGTSVWPQNFLIDYIRVYETTYNGPHNIPGTIENEDYDNGGEGVSYHSDLSTNASGVYRSDGVQIENGGGADGPDVDGAAAGQWLKYTANVAQSGTYQVGFYVSSPNGGSFHLQDALGNNLTGSISVPAQSGWQMVTGSLSLSAGTQSITLAEDTAGVSFDYMSFELTSEAPFDGVHNIPGTLQAEDFDTGGQSIGYGSTLTSNPDNSYRNVQADIAPCSDGGMALGLSAGQWFNYTVQVGASGQYNIAFRVASAAGGSLHITDEDSNPVGSEVTVPNTGSSTTYSTVTIPATLTAGPHVYTVTVDTGGFYADFMSFAYGRSAPYNGAHVVPGLIQMDDYDNGGPGVGFSPNGTYNQGGAYRADQVGISSCYASNEGDYCVESIAAGQWFNYTVQVQTTGQYLATFTVESGASGGSFHVNDENGNNLTGSIAVPGTGGWQDDASVCAPLSLTAGTHTLQVVVDQSGFNFNQMVLATTGPVASVSLSPTEVSSGGTSTATVTISDPSVNTLDTTGDAVDGEYLVISADNPAATFSGSNVSQSQGVSYLFIPSGQSTGTFTVNAGPVATQTVTNIALDYYDSPRSAPLTVDPIAPPAPTGIAANAVGNAQIDLVWTVDQTATSYNVFRGTSSGGESPTPIGTTSTASFTDTGLTIGATYFYTVDAVNPAGTSPQSVEVGATAVSAPTGLTAVAGDGLVFLAWNTYTGASSYNVYRSTTQGGEGATPYLTAITGTGYTDTGLTDGTTYFYLVAGVSAAATSGTSTEASATPVATPSGVTATSGDTLISLLWNASAGASSYNIYRSTTQGGEGTTPYQTGITGTNYSDTGLTDGTTYYYTLNAVNSTGSSPQSKEVDATPLATPTGLTATAGNLQITLAWTASAGAATYDIYRSTTTGSEGSTPLARGITTAIYTDTGLTDGTTYYYTLNAVNSSGSSPQSEEVNVTPLATPTALTADSSDSQITLTWSASAGATTYAIYRSTTTGTEGSTPYASGIATAGYTDNGLTNGTTYYYAVSGVNAGSTSKQSVETSATPVGTPSSLTAVSSDSKIILRWTGSVGATGYNVYRGTESGDEGTTPLNASPISALTYTDTGLTNGSYYYYEVAGINASGTSSMSPEAGAVPVATPIGVAAVAGNSNILIYWNQSAGASTYRLYRSTTPAGEGTTPYQTGISTPSYTDTGLTNGTRYYYTVDAANSTGASPLSTEVSATPYPVNVTGLHTDSITQGSWKGVYGADGYNVIGDAGSPKYPSYATVTTFGASTTVWTSASTAANALQSAAAGSYNRVAGAWYVYPTFPVDISLVDISLTDGKSHQVALYLLDWGNTGRSEIITVSDPVTRTVLNTQTVTDFGGGIYCVWNEQGDIRLSITHTAGANAVLSALFFGPGTGKSAPAVPTGLAALGGVDRVSLSWTATPDATSYNVYRSTSSGAEGATPIKSGLAGTAYTDTTVVEGTKYYYQLMAVNAVGGSPACGEVSAKPLPSSASFVKTDTKTLGSWKGVYGGDGRNIVGDAGGPKYPAYASVTPSGVASAAWSSASTAAYALQAGVTGSTDRLVGAWYSASSFSVDINLTDGKPHQVALYLLDWASGGRSETITVSDPVSHATLNTQTATDFGGGVYYVWTLQGHVTLTITRKAGPNAVLSALFFGPGVGNTPPPVPTGLAAVGGVNQVSISWTATAGATSYYLYRSATSGAEGATPIKTGLTGATYTDTTAAGDTKYYYQLMAVNAVGGSPASSEVSAETSSSIASFVKTDPSTEGNWKGVYGKDGYNIIGDPSAGNPSYPDYAKVSPSGQAQVLWTESSTAAYALQSAASNSANRLLGAWYAPSTFSIDVRMTGAVSHELALYLVDWANSGRSETITISDAATHAMLSSKSATGFAGGVYYVWNVQGHVTITVSRSTGSNAVVSGLFFR